MRWIANKDKNYSNTHGQLAEQIAKEHIQEEGLIFIEQNFHSRWGEIDLIMKDNEVFVFIEVKYRKNTVFGGAISAISTKKQQKIIKTAAIYLQQHGLNEYNTAYRFDVVAIEGNINSIAKPQINWLKNAFN
ncbi:YraN family protein [Thalassotalea profundi]|uniref:UPF0102 protein GCM10011501_07880 n=1 Tax=Thalassotalea profundi TaxID=2036687 RepID=A0ABQ3IJ46_9GAMM|nr:YraN family protein [Thalassotalea profundi]GHE81926.1 UPF0102 protein [Thalassotalea profundi]